MSNIDPKYLQSRLLHRANDSHKGDYGHLLIVAGCIWVFTDCMIDYNYLKTRQL